MRRPLYDVLEMPLIEHSNLLECYRSNVMR